LAIHDLQIKRNSLESYIYKYKDELVGSKKDYVNQEQVPAMIT
jgi:hypothetical protein